MPIRCVFFGAENTGKTELFKALSSSDNFNERYEATIGVDFKSMIHNSDRIQCWDLPGQARFKSIVACYFRGAHIAFYAIDLSKNICETISNDISEFKTNNPNIILYIVGTKSDLCLEGGEEACTKIAKDNGNLGYLSTSAKNGIGIGSLLGVLHQCLEKDVDSQQVRQESYLEKQIHQFKNTLKDLPQDTSRLIEKELGSLRGALNKDIIYNKAQRIELFTKNCHNILAGKYPNIMKAVFTLAAVALVTLIAGLVGFGIGFAAGAWTGPGAFITGFMTGNAAACSVVSIAGFAGLAGGYTAYGLFKDSKAIIGLNEFVDSLQHLTCGVRVEATDGSYYSC